MKGFSSIKFTQIAIWVPNRHSTMGIANDLFKQARLLDDDLLMDGQLVGDTTNSELGLSYLFGLVDELEIEYIEPMGDHWLNERISDGKPFISHLGSYCSIDTMNECIQESYERGIGIIQKTISHSHTNERKDGPIREYFDVIFDTEMMLGFNIKLTAKADGNGLEVLK